MGVRYEATKTPCRNRRGVPLGKGGQMQKLQRVADPQVRPNELQKTLPVDD